MNTKLTLGLLVILTAAVGLIASGTLLTAAHAAIRDACQKNGSTKEGSCTGNTDKNGKQDVRLNPADKAPPGQQP